MTLPIAGLEAATSVGHASGIMSVVPSLLFPSAESLNILRAQDGFTDHPIILPPPSALLDALARGFFSFDPNGPPKEDWQALLTWGLRKHGINWDNKGTVDKDLVDYDKFQKIWQRVYQSVLTRPNVEHAFMGRIAGILQPLEFQKMLRMNGCTLNDWEWLVPFYSNKLSIDQLIELYRRGLINDGGFNKYARLIQYGIPGDIDNLKRLSTIIPHYTDLVRFAIRDAFSPDLVQAFQLDAELEKAQGFLDFAYASGLGEVEIKNKAGKVIKEDMAKMFWRSHWIMPSPTQAYEFLHRLYPQSRYGPSPSIGPAGKFDSSDLKLLLRASDYSPHQR